MDYSAANTGLWNAFVYLGVIAGLLLLGNALNRKVRFVRNSLLPVSALAGFLLLILRNTGLMNIPMEILEMITYHGIALGFIALSLRTTKEAVSGSYAMKSGALIVSTYLIQGVVGLVVTVLLGITVMPGLFKAAGLLLPMAYGQGPGQANNVGSSYEALGFIGGRSFGLSLAAAGYLSACLVGLWYTRRLMKRRGLDHRDVSAVSGSVTVDIFQDENEVPLEESIDRFSTQVALVLVTYLATFLVTLGITTLVERLAPVLVERGMRLVGAYEVLMTDVEVVTVWVGSSTAESISRALACRRVNATGGGFRVGMAVR